MGIIEALLLEYVKQALSDLRAGVERVEHHDTTLTIYFTQPHYEHQFTQNKQAHLESLRATYPTIKQKLKEHGYTLYFKHIESTIHQEAPQETLTIVERDLNHRAPMECNFDALNISEATRALFNNIKNRYNGKITPRD